LVTRQLHNVLRIGADIDNLAHVTNKVILIPILESVSEIFLSRQVAWFMTE